MSLRREGEKSKTADGRELQQADSRRQVAEGRGPRFLSRLPSASCRLPSAVLCRLLSAVPDLYRSGAGCAKLLLAFPHVGHCLGCPLGSAGSVDSSRDVRSGDAVLVMGGGASYRIGERLLEHLEGER